MLQHTTNTWVPLVITQINNILFKNCKFTAENYTVYSSTIYKNTIVDKKHK